MRLQINDIIGRHKNQKCIIVGHGPSLNDFVHILKDYKDKGFIIVGCNNWYEFYEHCPPHYWLNANNEDTVIRFLPIINKHKETTFIYADSIDLSEKHVFENKIESDWLTYDQRHFKGKKCVSCPTYKCDKFLDEKRLTIQEELQKLTGYHELYSSAHTVAIHMLSFAALMQFSEIYIVGLDFDYHNGYAKNTTNRSAAPHINHFDLHNFGAATSNDVEIVNNSAKRIGTKFYNTNLSSWWKNIEYKPLPSL